MNIINQPFQGQLGSILIDELTQGYDQFVFFSAFAKNSGVLRMKPALRQFRTGGGKITVFIGIDLNGTSYEALLNLFYLCDQLYVIHSEDPATTYHSKVYLLTNDRYAWCAVGSNNFTGGGSRNILDLSKLGKIESGSVSGTPYQYTDNIHMYGGIKFFEIDPDNVDMTKNITINYQGKDYFPSTKNSHRIMAVGAFS